MNNAEKFVIAPEILGLVEKFVIAPEILGLVKKYDKKSSGQLSNVIGQESMAQHFCKYATSLRGLSNVILSWRMYWHVHMR